MKTIALILTMVCIVSCKKETSTKTEVIIPDTKETSSKVETNDTSEDIDLGGLMEGFGELLGDSDATDSLKQVLSSTDDKMDLDFLKDLKNGDGEIDTAVWLDLLEKSGASREEMEKLINNPDSLDALLTEMKKTRESSASQKDNTSTQTDGSIAGNPGQNAGSGISLEDAIKMVQDESGIDATMAKLKQGDSLAGTNTMSQIPTDPDAINKLPMSNMEQEIIDRIRKMSGNLHSENEAKALVKLIEKEELKSSNNPQATERFKAALKYNRSGAKIHSDDLKRKSKAAKTKFKKLNPDLFYGDDVGVSYVGNLKKTVYLPLGPLSFADEIVNVRHPKLMTNDVKNVLGEPDVVETFDDATGIYSLGLGGTLTIRFTDNALVDVNGPDLYLFEIGQLEPTELEISKDG
ncbi:MAG: hypothetical protein HKN99_01405, partial [Winogradskyella sp.]|nr:hypothetical protein [Winogradskyella sp.]